ncbi:hypothetical protein JMJ58_02460 [Haloterrigena salifodinae]|uniref:Uncharacterized protein n=1 Tax=Haloterrigena salifodinae TaxID=2675099 RepID=A0A8T8E1S2_9EURY|nr:hypothetical protein [Haloterrigena salifodinae]QRV15785.1 hypothetical protein JMJ58_02460 [Haloterrigena salifodinae]
MCNDDSRSNESSDRRNGPTHDNQDAPFLEEALETIDYLTRTLLADDHKSPTRFRHCSRARRREIRRRLREIRAEASRIGLVAIGPEAAMPYRPEDDSSPGPSGVTTYSGPEPGVDDLTYHTPDFDTNPESNSPSTEESASDSSSADTDPNDTTTANDGGERDD